MDDMKSFERNKRLYLKNKSDKSKKGSIDNPIKALIIKINSSPFYYSTSSCSGRIMLFEKKGSSNKKDTDWPYITHDIADEKKIISTYNEYRTEKTILSFRMEGAILHIAAFDIDKAQRLLDLARLAGFKRSGIIATKKRVILELLSTEYLDTPIIIDSRHLVDEIFLKELTKQANRKLKQTWKKIDSLNRAFHS